MPELEPDRHRQRQGEGEFRLLRHDNTRPHQRACRERYPCRELFALLKQIEVRSLQAVRGGREQGAREIPAEVQGSLDRADNEDRFAVESRCPSAPGLPVLSPRPYPLLESTSAMPWARTARLLDWGRSSLLLPPLERTALDRIRVEESAKPHEGRPFIAAIIAAPETLANLDKYRAIQARVADPRSTTDTQAEQLIAQGKTVVLITCSIHATEVASTQRLSNSRTTPATEDKPRFRAILQNTIFILVPSLNPDGVDIVTAGIARPWARHTKERPRRSCITSTSATITIATGTSSRSRRRA